jgi:hypothetical protein
MLKTNLIIFLFLFNQGFKKTFDTGLNVSQSYYNSSWEGGDVGTVIWVYYINSDIKGKIKNKWNIINTFKLQFGQTYIQDNETREWSKPQKSTDKIEEELTVFYDVVFPFKPYISNRFLSQIYDNSYPDVPLYINPIDLTHTIGILKEISQKEEQNWFIRWGIGSKENIIRTVDTTNKTVGKTEVKVYGGTELYSEFKKKIRDNILYEARLRIFKALINSEEKNFTDSEEKNFWKEPDIDFENTLSISITKYIQISLYLQLLYDKEISKSLQLKQTLALGIVYKLF